jgi:hypothetical protein
LIAIAFDLHDSFYAVVAWQASASFCRFTISTLKARQPAVHCHSMLDLRANHLKSLEEAHLTFHQNLENRSNLRRRRLDADQDRSWRKRTRRECVSGPPRRSTSN